MISLYVESKKRYKWICLQNRNRVTDVENKRMVTRGDGCCSSVTQSCLTLWPHGLQHTRLPCPSLSPSVCSNSCPLSQWCHPTISSSTAPFSFWPQSFPASGSFPMSQLIKWPKFWSFSISPSNEYSELISFKIDWFDLAVQGALKSLLQHHDSKASLVLSLLYGPALTYIHDYWKNHSFDYKGYCHQSDIPAF